MTVDHLPLGGGSFDQFGRTFDEIMVVQTVVVIEEDEPQIWTTGAAFEYFGRD